MPTKYGFLLIGDHKTVSVAPQWKTPDEAKEASNDFAVRTRSGPNARFILVEDRRAETIEFLQSKGKDASWLTHCLTMTPNEFVSLPTDQWDGSIDRSDSL